MTSHRYIRLSRSIAAALLMVAINGCQTTKMEDIEWVDISLEESILKVPALSQPGSPEVKIRKRSSWFKVDEHWVWPGGELWLTDLYPGRYYSIDYDSPEVLVKRGSQWNRIKSLGITIHKENTRRTRDRQNNTIPYAIERSKSGNDICFIAMRSTRKVRGGDKPMTANPAGGWLTLYICANASDVSESEFEEMAIEFASGIRLKS